MPGSQCNSRGFCTLIEERTKGECSVQSDLPKDKIARKWGVVADAMVKIAKAKGVAVEGKPATDATKLIGALTTSGAISEQVEKALQTLNTLQKAAQAGTRIDKETADKFVALADKVIALLK